MYLPMPSSWLEVRFSRINHTLGNKSQHTLEIKNCVFSNYNVMKLEISNEENWKIHKYIEIQSLS